MSTDPAVPSGKFAYVLHSCIRTWMSHYLAGATRCLQELLQATGLSICSLKFQTVIHLIFQNVIISLNSFVPRHVTKCAGLLRHNIARLTITCALQISSRDVTAMCTAQHSAKRRHQHHALSPFITTSRAGHVILFSRKKIPKHRSTQRHKHTMAYNISQRLQRVSENGSVKMLPRYSLCSN